MRIAIPKSDWLVIAAITLVSFGVRITLFPFESGDYKIDMSIWYDFIVANGRFLALGQEFSNYPPLYLYMLVAATLLPLSKLFAIKIVYVVFDYIIGMYVFRIARLLFPNNDVPIRALLFVLFLPTVLLNSSLWGQCDAMYTAGMIAGLYYILSKEHLKAFVAYSIAASLKPQAIFLGPLFLFLAINGRFSWLYFYLIPLIYLVLAVPVVFAGRSLLDVLFLYVNQRILPKPSLTLGATNVYQWLSDDYFNIIFKIGIIVAFLTAVAFVIAAGKLYRNNITDARIVQVGFISVVLCPYLLPAMHERYFFPADVFSLVYALYYPRRYYYVILIQICSLFSYLPYLFHIEPIPRSLLALIMGAVLLLALMDMRCESNQKSCSSNN